MSAKPYHHGNLRGALVEAAVDAVRREGPSGLALRELARTVGVSHNAAYRHFADRDALVAEVGMRGMAELAAAMERRLAEAQGTGPVLRARQRLHGAGRGYVDFALGEPGLFRVAFAAYTSTPEGLETPEADPYGLLNQCLDDLVEVGWLSAHARPDTEISCWSAVHGFATLCLDGPLRDAPEDARALALTRMLQLIDRSLAATTGRLAELGALGGAPD